MFNFNGTLVDQSTVFSSSNRALLFGDALFETIRVVDGIPYFWEDHYFRLMASMRILRMRIPGTFTMEYLESQLKSVVAPEGPFRVRLTVYRNEGGYYTPTTNTVSFFIESTPLASIDDIHEETPCIADLYKDFHVPNHLLSTLKTTNRLLNIVGAVYAQENELDTCIVLNEQKRVAEVLNGNLFMLQGKKLVTPPLSEGCLNGILRKQMLKMVTAQSEWEVEEAPISPFELQNADELFYTNAIQGIRSITHYRKKEFVTTQAQAWTVQLNQLV
ncbi:aminotransferase class IV [Flavobacterium sp.]|uniref:aminotransferase class IV n=1 Tax=Flavobacterium sp. TaxID=239 RepID=UPI003918E594